MNYYSGNQSTAQEREEDQQQHVDQLRNDTGLSIAELKSIMGNRKEWMKLVMEFEFARNKQVVRC